MRDPSGCQTVRPPGYLETELRRGFPGKPAKLYRLAQGPITLTHPPRQFALLAQHLAVALDGFGPAGLGAARNAGRQLATTLEIPGELRTVKGSLQPLEALGAAFELTGSDIAMTNCLFHEACPRSQAVREFQAGLLEGLIERARPNLRVEAAPLKSPVDPCRFQLIEGARAARAGAGQKTA